jgi:hypothetical protein
MYGGGYNKEEMNMYRATSKSIPGCRLCKIYS